MKKRYFVIFLLLLSIAFCLSACDDTNHYDGQAKVTFDLVGGEYKNCTLPVVHYYKLQEGETCKIKELAELSRGDLIRSGYELDGWYKTLNKDGTYADKWSFESDTIDSNGVTLYAKWKKPYKYTYQFCYNDEIFNDEVILGSFTVDEGETCQLALADIQFANARDGYTMVDYRDKDGNLWDESFVHPGGEGDLAVKVYVDYVKGDYAVVKEAGDFVAGKDIYLARDIDMKGRKFSLSFFTKGKFEGNNHTISNFEIDYTTNRNDLVSFDNSDNNIVIGLFGLLNEATIRNVTFENVKVDVNTSFGQINNIYVAPLSGSIIKSTIDNVKVINFDCTYSRLPSSFYQDGDRSKPLVEGKLNIVDDKLSYADSESTITNCKVTAKTNADD